MRKEMFCRITTVICACLFITTIALAQTKSITGVVSDENGKPLVGATVSQKGGNAVTTSTIRKSFAREPNPSKLFTLPEVTRV